MRGTRPGRPPGEPRVLRSNVMAVVLFALFLLVPIVELTVIITVGARIGVVLTLGLMILM